MTFAELKNRVIQEYDSRQLKSNQRYRAIDKLDEVLKRHNPAAWKDVSKLPTNKHELKQLLAKEKGSYLNDGEDFMVDEVYKQLSCEGIR